MSLMIVGAASFELDPLVQSLQQAGIDAEPITVGVGAIKAAQNSAAVASKCRGKHVVFVGTCGAFAPFERVELVRVASVYWAPTAERLGMSYAVKGTTPAIKMPAPPVWAKELPARKAICGPSISLVSRVPEGFNSDQIVENLELYSCASALAGQASSFCAILGITNRVGPDAHSQWKQHFRSAAGKTAEFVSSALSGKTAL